MASRSRIKSWLDRTQSASRKPREGPAILLFEVLGFRVWGIGFGFRVQGSGFGVLASGFWVLDFGLTQAGVFWLTGSGVRALGSRSVGTVLGVYNELSLGLNPFWPWRRG